MSLSCHGACTPHCGLPQLGLSYTKPFLSLVVSAEFNLFLLNSAAPHARWLQKCLETPPAWSSKCTSDCHNHGGLCKTMDVSIPMHYTRETERSHFAQGHSLLLVEQGIKLHLLSPKVLSPMTSLPPPPIALSLSPWLFVSQCA